METYRSKSATNCSAFCEYLTYKEWKLSRMNPLLSPSLNCDVSTLPIRNGNYYRNDIVDAFLRCEYLTYKEWKLTWVINRYSCDLDIVSTLPIRNGNILKRTHKVACSSNREYLTYKEWKRKVISRIPIANFCVSTLPIRNGNSDDVDGVRCQVNNSVSTLPIRNGNMLPPLSSAYSSDTCCEYLTYKEWKQ